MQSIHKVVKVINNQVIINLPPGFEDSLMEVILKPTHKKKMIQALEKEIDIGLNSKESPRTHREIFNTLKAKYGSL